MPTISTVAGVTEFDVRYTSDNGVDPDSTKTAASIRNVSKDTTIQLPFKSGTEPSTGGSPKTITYEWDYTSATPDDNGPYELIIGGQTDEADPPNQSASVVLDTITLDIGGTASPAGTLLDFRGINSLPSGWVQGTGSLSFDADGVLIPANTAGDWYANTVTSNQIALTAGKEYRIDFELDTTDGGASFAVGLSKPFGLFTADSCLLLFSGDTASSTIWKGGVDGSAAVGGFGDALGSGTYRLIFNNIASGQIDVSLYKDESGTLTQVGSTNRVGLPAALLPDARIYFDAKGTPIKIIEVFLSN